MASRDIARASIISAAAMPFSARGVYTALVTPFLPPSSGSVDAGGVDMPAFEALVRAQIAAGVAGVVPCGTTGESATLRREEASALIATAVRLCAGTGVSVVAGTGSNDTAEAAARTAAAAAAGADAALLVMPYYNKPSQAGLAAHVRAVAAAAPHLPIVLYNVPGRTAVNLAPATVAALAAELPASIVAIKEASGSLDAVNEIMGACPPGFAVLCGDDALTLPMMALGAAGVVSVASNLVPRDLVALVDEAARGDLVAARRRHHRLVPLFRALFIETNPGPVKLAMELAGAVPRADMRLPLAPLEPASQAKLRAVLAADAEARGKEQQG